MDFIQIISIILLTLSLCVDVKEVDVMKKEYPKYSVLMSVYYKEKPTWFDESIKSMFEQTIKPNEFVLVEDGPLTKELYDVVEKYQTKYPKEFKVVAIEKNVGLGPALRKGVLNCKYDWIARADSDDISVKNRIEMQFNRIFENPKIDFIGSHHIEFIDNIKNVETYSYKKLPVSYEEILKYSKNRNPFSHSVMLIKKAAIVDSGNYREYHLVEDYDLWLRMIRKGYYCENIDDYLSYVRVSKDLYKRRGGLKYLKSINKFKWEQYKVGYFSLYEYIKSIVPHLIVCILPNKIRETIYLKILRKESK